MQIEKRLGVKLTSSMVLFGEKKYIYIYDTCTYIYIYIIYEIFYA